MDVAALGRQAGAALAGPFLRPADRVHLPFLGGALVLAMVWLLARGGGVRALRGLLPARLLGHPSARLDYLFFGLKALARPLGLLPGAAAALALAVAMAELLARLAPLEVPLAWGRPAAATIYTVVLFVSWDASRYLLHRFLHTVPALWEIHQVHHSAEVLTPFTLYRVHPVESFLFALRGIIVTGIISGVFFYLFRGGATQLDIAGVNALGYLLNLAGGNLRHSHVRLSYGRRLEGFLLSPAQHQVHHLRDPRCQRANYGTWLAIWDRLGGTLVRAQDARPGRFGLRAADRNHAPRRLGSALLGPLAAVARLLAARSRRFAA